MPDPIPVLTLWQPWASLIAELVKSIETRSWATKYRGRIGLASAAKRPRDGERVGPYQVRGFGSTGRALVGPGLPEFRSTPRLQGYLLPVGKIIATANLVDCVPTDEIEWCDSGRPDSPGWWKIAGLPAALTTQLPFGDFAPGRWAWLLADVVKLDEPVPFKGGQRLTRTWTPT